MLACPFNVCTASSCCSGNDIACQQVQPTAVGARNFSQCDSMLIGDTAAANTYPYIQVRGHTAVHSCSSHAEHRLTSLHIQALLQAAAAVTSYADVSMCIGA